MSKRKDARMMEDVEGRLSVIKTGRGIYSLRQSTKLLNSRSSVSERSGCVADKCNSWLAIHMVCQREN